MSMDLMSRIWEHSPHSGSPLLVLLCLADHANDEGVCWPSIPRIARRARISERQAMRALAELEASGELQVVERGGGKGKSNIYKVTPVTGYEPVDAAKDTVTSTSGLPDETVTSVSRKGDIEAPKGDIQRAKGDIAMSLEPSLRATLTSEPQEQSHTRLPKAEQDAARKSLEEHFKALTSLTVPPSKKEAGELWWAPLREICTLVNWVPDIGRELLTASVQRAKQNGTELSSPKSIIKYARAIRAAQLRGEAIIPGGNGRPGNARQGYDPAADMAAFKNRRGLK